MALSDPSVIVLGAFIAWPAAYSLYLSLYHWDLISPARRFVGLANYVRLMRDGQFWATAPHTLQ